MRAFLWFNAKRGGEYQSPRPGVPMRWLNDSQVEVLVAQPWSQRLDTPVWGDDRDFAPGGAFEGMEHLRD